MEDSSDTSTQSTESAAVSSPTEVQSSDQLVAETQAESTDAESTDAGGGGTGESLAAAVSSLNMDEVEQAWMEALGDGAVDGKKLESLVEHAATLWRNLPEEQRPRLGPLLDLLLSSVNTDTPSPALLQLHWHLVHVFPQKRKHSAAFSECFEEIYPVASAERAYYEASGFANAGNPSASLTRLETLLKFREGAYVFHESGWGVGRVTAVDPFLKQVRVDLEEKPGHRIAIDAVDSILQPLDPESFVVLRYDNPTELERLRDEDPLRLISLVLESYGNPQPIRDIKPYLVPDFITAGSWSKWWTRTKGLLRKSGYFRVGDRSPYLVERVETEISYAAELVQQFSVAKWPVARKIARQLARAKTDEEKNAWTEIAGTLQQISEGKDSDRALEASLILDRGSAGATTAFPAVVAKLEPAQISSGLQVITAAEEQKRAIAALREARADDWIDVARLLFLGRSDGLRDVTLGVLDEHAPEKGSEFVASLLRTPQASPEAFCYAVNQRASSKLASLSVFRDATDGELLLVLFDLLDHVRHREQRDGPMAVKDVLGRICAVLERNSMEFFRKGLGLMSRAKRREAYDRIRASIILPSDLRAGLIVAAVNLDGSLEKDEEKPFWEDESAIFVTAEGLARRKDEFRELMEVKLPENFEAIGRAADFGDLSENAEYTSALEERDRLTKRATEMKEQLDIARTLEPSMVTTDRVGVGTRVRLERSDSGEEIEYAVLGPWDGRPEDGILYYRSPLAQSLLGCAAGDEVEVQLPGGTEHFKVLSVSSYF